MSWTYSGLPASGNRDEVRFLLQDVDENRQLMADEEMDYVRTQADPLWGSPYATAALCADILVGKFITAGQSISADGVSISLGDLVSQYKSLADNLRRTYQLVAGASAMPIAFGIDTFQCPDFGVRPGTFGLGFMDNFRSGRQDYGRRGEFGDYEGYEVPAYPGIWTGP